MITCAEAIKNATGKDYTVEQIDDFIKAAEDIKKKVNLDDSIADKTAEIQRRLQESMNGMQLAAKIEQRNKLINEKRRMEAVNFVQTSFPEDYGRGVQAYIVGDNKVAPGSRLSVDAEQKSLMGQYLGGLAADLEKSGYLKLVRSGTFDREIARAMWGDAVSKDAGAIADIISKWQEKARLDANDAGAWIGKDPHYITRQSHDIEKIAKADPQEYIQYLQSKLDLSKTLEGVENPQQFFESIYEAFASGVHLNPNRMSIEGAFKGSGNLGKRMSQERVLHFKSADDWMDYNDRFGDGRMMESILRGLEFNSRNTGLLRKLGTNPESMVDAMQDDLMRSLSGDPEAKKAFQRSKNKTSNFMKEVTGETMIPGNQMVAKWGSILRSIQSMSKLGGAVLSSFPDMVTYGSEVRYQGGSLLSGMGESFGALLKGRQDAEKRQIAANLGVGMDSFIGGLTDKFSVNDPLPGTMQKTMNLFFKLNGLSWWTDTMKISSAISTSNRLYQSRALKYAELDPSMQRVLKLYGIQDNEWGLISKATQVTSDKTGLVTPEAMLDKRKITDTEISSALESQGVKPSKAKIDNMRNELERKIRAYVSDRTGFAQLETDARAKALWNQGTQRGTAGGELLRMISQFKQYPTIFLQRTVGREITGRAKNTGSNNFTDSVMWNTASLFTALTVMGYASMSAKDIVKGREPRDPLSWKTFMAAAAQGGGAGIYGDFLFGDMKNRFGGGAISTLAGPTAGTFDQVIDIMQRMRDGDDAAASAYRAILNNTPFLNLFYTRVALDYMILYDISEAMNPGYLRRMERRIKKDNEQEFLLPPSTERLRPITN